MTSRRRLIQTSGAAVLLAPFAGVAARAADARDGAIVRFGVVADPQFAVVPPRGTQHFDASLGKLAAAAAEAFNTVDDLAFVVTLGDIIDGAWESFDAILPIYGRLRARSVFVLGNHDFAVPPELKAAVPHRLGLERGYYHFAAGGHRFIVLDGNEISVFATADRSAGRRLADETLARLAAEGAPNGLPWNGGLSVEQLGWLAATLDDAAAAGEPTLVFGHYPLLPLDKHCLWDSGAVVALLTRQPGFRAYFCGHNHRGGYATLDGRHFLTFKAMCVTPDASAFAVVEVHPDRIEVIGQGREPSRTLTL